MDRLEKIAFVIPWSIDHIGGVNEVVRSLMKECRSAGRYGPVLVENSWENIRPIIEDKQDYIRVRMRLRAIDAGNSFLSIIAFVLFLPITLIRIRRLLAQLNVISVNVHYPGLDSLNWIAAKMLRLTKGQISLSFHGSDIRSVYRAGRVQKSAFRFLLRAADSVVACSKGLLSEVETIEPKIRGAVVHNGINSKGAPDRNIISESLPESALERPIISSVGVFAYRKGHDILLQAFRSVLDRNTDVHLVIAGGHGQLLESTRDMISELGLANNVSLLVDVPHPKVMSLLAMSTIFVMSSRWIPGELGEGFPIAILEAAAARCAVVSTRTCGVDELIDDGHSGLLVPLDDPVALATAIDYLLNDVRRAEKFATRLHEVVAREFTWARAYKRYEKLLVH